MFWGFWAVLALLMGIAGLMEGIGRRDGPLLLGLCVASVVLCYVAHRLTCWIVNGFTNS